MLFFKKDKLSVPKLGFGTFRMNDKEARKATLTAIETGYRHIDTAQAYENESGVGQACRESGIKREALFLTTKIWYNDLSGSAIPAKCEESLNRLQTDYIDLMLIHWPSKEIPLEESLQALSALKKEGKIKNIGVSNFPRRLFETATTLEDIVCNQVEYHPFLGQGAVIEAARRSRAMVTAYCPLGQGNVAHDAVLAGIGARYNKSAAQVALRWLVQQQDVAAIPKAANPEHIRKNFEIFDFELTEDDMHKIFALPKDRRVVNPSWAPQWDK